ncbi:MAG TPA: CAP domain-containing protein [Candidatus Saccharimonadia bacterium]|nr:CAP domain-containing protein [Candidatus Saccharimonadia bacterium]
MLLALAALPAGAGGPDPIFADGFEDVASAGEPASLAGMVAAHNAVRASVLTATPLPALAWSDSLAATAQAWANQCVDVDSFSGIIDHNPNRSSGYPWYVGENIYASTATPTAAQAVASWASEVADYNYATNTCTPNRVCGHYTQLVWRSTLLVGCARSDCPSLTYRHSIVCNYGPGGNTGGRPY